MPAVLDIPVPTIKQFYEIIIPFFSKPVLSCEDKKSHLQFMYKEQVVEKLKCLLCSNCFIPANDDTKVLRCPVELYDPENRLFKCFLGAEKFPSVQ